MHYLPTKHASAGLDMRKIIYDETPPPFFAPFSSHLCPSHSSPPIFKSNFNKMCHPYSFCMMPLWKPYRSERSVIHKFFTECRVKTTKQEWGKDSSPCNSITHLRLLCRIKDFERERECNTKWRLRKDKQPPPETTYINHYFLNMLLFVNFKLKTTFKM